MWGGFEAKQTEICRLIECGVSIYRIKADYGGEQRIGSRNAAGIVAMGKKGATDSAGNRGSSFALLVVQLGGIAGRLGRLECRNGFRQFGTPAVCFLLGDSMALQQLIRALANPLSIFQRSRGAGDLGRCPIKLRLVPAAIDHEEHVTSLNNLPRCEMDFGDMSGNPRTNLNRVHGIDSGGCGFPVDDLALFTGRHSYRRRRRSVISFGVGEFTSSDRDHPKEGECQMARSNSIHRFGWRCNCVQNFLSGWLRLNYATNERPQMRHQSELHCSHIHEQGGRGKPDRNFLGGLTRVGSPQSAPRFPNSTSSRSRSLARKAQ